MLKQVNDIEEATHFKVGKGDIIEIRRYTTEAYKGLVKINGIYRDPDRLMLFRLQSDNLG